MQRFVIELALLGLLAAPASLFADSSTPLMRRVEPGVAQAGDVVKVTGDNLGRANVAALYLTDGKNDTKVVIVEETTNSIVFKIPAETEQGRLTLMILTTGDSPKLLEEPVKITIQ